VVDHEAPDRHEQRRPEHDQAEQVDDLRRRPEGGAEEALEGLEEKAKHGPVSHGFTPLSSYGRTFRLPS
jgi:hypothetical protein